MKLTLSREQAYARKQRLWRLHCEHAQTIRRAFFPDTGGVSLYLHNWHRCSRDPVRSKLADWIEESTYARYRRLADAMEARDTEREHLTHGAHFSPYWCAICHPECAHQYKTV